MKFVNLFEKQNWAETLESYLKQQYIVVKYYFIQYIVVIILIGVISYSENPAFQSQFDDLK